MEEAALVARAEDERIKIFERYDRGREQGAQIDDWEDPSQIEIYHKTDRHGFIHDTRLPNKRDQTEQKAIGIERIRETKWRKMYANWNSRKTQEVLHRRIYKGIPLSWRPPIWIKLLDVEKTMAEKKDVYKKMLKLARESGTEARQIDSDVNRQFRDHMFYRERYSEKQKSLFNVLTAYSMYNMEVGYCQGMSGIAGVLLMYMDEEQAFWALNTLLTAEKYAMHGLYINGFPKLRRFLEHHDKIITKFLPNLKKHFDQYNLDSILYSLKWFFVIFTERIPFSLCLRVWDIYLLDGERVVTAMAFTILRLHRTKLLKLKDMDLVVQYLQTKLYNDFGFDDDYVIKKLEEAMEDLKKVKMDLPPPPQPDELPKRIGEVLEPSTDAKTGRRTSTFTDAEKEVTQSVILKREQIVQELAESQAMNGSTGQLNLGHNIPESEDGGSLLGSSRKSLADTSVTSTADLSVFSGQRSQQAFDIHIDESRSMVSEDDPENHGSPGSPYCSLSALGRNTSLTPTPRAISPQDIVRIYVPPAPPEEQLQQQSQQKQSIAGYAKDLQSDANTKSPIHNKNSIKNNKIYSFNANGGRISSPPRTLHGLEQSNKNSIIYGSSDSMKTPVHYAFNKSDEELALSFADTSLGSNNHSLVGQTGPSSSSRRGSLSRKSPSAMFESNVLLECSHMIQRRLSNQSNSSINFEIGRDRSIKSSQENINVNQNYGDASIAGAAKMDRWQFDSTSNGYETQKVMTSFEQLATLRSTKGSDTDDYSTRGQSYENVHLDKDGMYRRQYDTDQSPDDDEHFSYSYKSIETTQRSPSVVASGKKFRSENNVQYETITLRPGSATTSTDIRKHRPNSSGNEIFTEYEIHGPPVQPKGGIYKKSASASLKEYKRFYGTSTEEAGDDEGPKRSSDESSSSPNRTVLNSPDTVIPLLQSPMGTSSPTRRSRIPISISASADKHSSLYQASAMYSGISSPSELNRILPPIEIASNTSSSNIIYDSRQSKLSPTSPMSPNRQRFGYKSTSSSRISGGSARKIHHSQNGSTVSGGNTGGDTNTIRIKVNQAMK